MLGVVFHAPAFASVLELNLPTRLKTFKLTESFRSYLLACESRFVLPKLTELEYGQLTGVGFAVSRSLQSAQLAADLEKVNLAEASC